MTLEIIEAPGQDELSGSDSQRAKIDAERKSYEERKEDHFWRHLSKQERYKRERTKDELKTQLQVTEDDIPKELN